MQPFDTYKWVEEKLNIVGISDDKFTKWLTYQLSVLAADQLNVFTVRGIKTNGYPRPTKFSYYEQDKGINKEGKRQRYLKLDIDVGRLTFVLEGTYTERKKKG